MASTLKSQTGFFIKGGWGGFKGQRLTAALGEWPRILRNVGRAKTTWLLCLKSWLALKVSPSSS
jgi:hypothetical protein